MRSLRLRLLPIRRPWRSSKKTFLYIHHFNIFSYFVHIEGYKVHRSMHCNPNFRPQFFTQPCCNTHSMTGVM